MAQELEHPHTPVHPRRHRLERIEGIADLMTLGLVVALGIAMVVGLATASGQVTW